MLSLRARMSSTLYFATGLFCLCMAMLMTFILLDEKIRQVKIDELNNQKSLLVIPEAIDINNSENDDKLKKMMKSLKKQKDNYNKELSRINKSNTTSEKAEQHGN